MRKEYLMEKPIRKRKGHRKLFEDLEEFRNADAPIMKLDWTDGYASARSCGGTYASAIQRYGFAMKVEQINGEVYVSKLV